MDDQNRHDPFGEDDFLGDVAAFEPKKSGREKTRPQEGEVEKIAQARGFDNRASVSKPVKEALRPLQFRLPASEVEAFHQRAYEEFGMSHGAKVSLFRKIWKAYLASLARLHE
jgi:hypothetical protein